MPTPPVDILYWEGPCLAVAKPPGLLTQAPPGIDSMEVRIKALVKDREHETGKVYLGVPHRLDRPASGAMVFARHVRACRRLAEQFEARSVEKKYWACVEGHIEQDAGTWVDHVRKIPGEARTEIVPAEHSDGREAILRYRTLERRAWGTWLAIELLTGRTHQVRVQAASRGHPVLGDALYGSTSTFGPQFEDPRLRAIALHARRLSFLHPMIREPVTVTAPLPQPWAELELEETSAERGQG